MIDARSYYVRETLRNGMEVCIRALRPDDGERIAEAFSNLDPESIYSRFFSFKRKLNEADYRLIREMDFDNRVALIVTHMVAGREVVIASSSYARCGDDMAEVAFVVEEDMHGLGIARRLLMHLGRIARDRGISHFIAEVLVTNAAMLRVFSAVGWPMKKRIVDGTVHVTLSLKDAPAG
ncbi:MAG: GNAT family N-acetyltransferase [Candidatus Dechloromonas phosphoritropha]